MGILVLKVNFVLSKLGFISCQSNH